jgi:nitrogen fixation-related uncharacterized protein
MAPLHNFRRIIMATLIFVLIILSVTIVPLIALAILWNYCCKQEQSEESREDAKSSLANV